MSNPSYSRVNWEDSPSTNTPINAENLNKMDKGISDCASAIATKQESTDNNLTTTAKTIRGAINEINADLTELDDRVNANTLDTAVDLDSNWYTAPSDGYLIYQSGGGNSAGYIEISDGTISFNICTITNISYNNIPMVFIKKGLKMRVGIGTVTMAKFYPLSV